MAITMLSYPCIRVYTFGHFYVERLINKPSSHEAPHYEPVAKEEWRSRGPAIALLKLLICRNNRRISRDIILDTLWPEAEAEKAMKSLDVAASVLRSVLNANQEKSLLTTIHTGNVSIIKLSHQQELWVDADAFDSYLAQANRAETQGENPLPFLEAAQELIKGEFLEDDVYEEWTQTRRHTIDAARHRLLHRLTNIYIQRNLYDQAESLLQSSLIENPTNEDALCQLMSILAQQGRRKEAINLYKKTVRFLQEEQQKKPSQGTRELAERIYKEPTNFEKSVKIYTPASKRHAQAIDTLLESPNHQSQHTPEDTAQHWLLKSLNDLTHLIESGWTISDVLTSIQTTLSGLVTIPLSSQQHLIQLASGALLGDQHALLESTSLHSWQLAAAVNTSDATCWSIFNTVPVPSLLLSSQVQKRLIQQLHASLPSQVMPFLYSSVYRLMGAALFFQARYAEALQAHKQSYLCAIEACDPWNMAESLAWQAGIWKACGQHHKAIEETEKALRLTSESDNPQALVLKARLLAHLAESAALLQQRSLALEKLSASAELLNTFEANQEFDASDWQQYQATCALYLGDTENAALYFHQALDSLNPTKTLQRAYTAQFLVQTYLKLGKLEATIKAARNALPLITSTNSLLLTSSFVEDVQRMHKLFTDNEEIESIVAETSKQIQPLIQRAVPRYLEATL